MLYSLNPTRLKPGPIILLLFAGIIAVMACKKKEATISAPPLATLEQLVSSDPDLTIAAAAITHAGLNSSLGSTNAFTFFAPVNAAFRSYLGKSTDADAITAINSMDAATVSYLLNYHLLAAKARSEDLPQNGVVVTLQNTTANNLGRLFIRRFQNTIHINDATVLQADINASNGELHKIDKVLTSVQGNILTTLNKNSNFSVLVALITRAGLLTTYTGPGPFTLFAPTDDAFLKYYSFLPLKEKAQQQGISLKQALVDTILGFTSRQVGNYLTPILQAHILAKNQLAYTNDLPTDGTQLATQNLFAPLSSIKGTTGWEVYSKAGSTPSHITNPDVMANNGVLQFIDQVLEVPLTVAQAAAQDPQLSIFNAMIPNTNVSASLNGIGTYTIFAPVNSVLHSFFDPIIHAVVSTGYASNLTYPNFTNPPDTSVVRFLQQTWGKACKSPSDCYPFPDLDPIVKYLIVNDSTVTNAAALPDGGPLYTLLGTPPLSDPNSLNGSVFGRLFVHKPGGVIHVNDNVTVLQTDIKASNGVLHKVDNLLAAPQYSLGFAANLVSNTTVWTEALKKSGLSLTLNGLGPFTVFAPSDDAFNTYFKTTYTAQTIAIIDGLSATQLQDMLVPLLNLHILGNNKLLYTVDANLGGSYPSLASGSSLTINKNGSIFTVMAAGAAANLTRPDVQYTNGVLHVIDKVLQ